MNRSPAFLLLFLLITPIIYAQETADGFPIKIDILGIDPPPKRPVTPLVPQGGWPLTIELTNEEAGILQYSGISPLPNQSLPLNKITSIRSYAVGILLFSNPDGISPGASSPNEAYCLSFLDYYFGSEDFQSQPGPDPELPPYRDTLLSTANHEGCPSPLPADEKHLYFALGTDLAAEDVGWPENPAGEPSPAAGASPRLPGLVILSDSGIGNVYMSNGSGSYVLTPQRQARNLAAYINAVGYFLRNNKGKTAITASWIAPQNIISPYIERDSNVGGTCSDISPNTSTTALRINGSPTLTYLQEGSPDFPSSYGVLDYYLLKTFTVRLRMFVVNGPAPAVLPDSNNDGKVDYLDAVQEGYELLSGQKTIFLRIAHNDFTGQFIDLDGNGCAGHLVLPGGAGGLGTIPR